MGQVEMLQFAVHLLQARCQHVHQFIVALQFALQFDPAYLSFSGFVQDAMLVDSNAYSFQEEADGVVKLQ